MIAFASFVTSAQQAQSASSDRKQAATRGAEERERLAELMAEPEPSLQPDPEAIKRARRRSIVSQMRRRGRASTILTDTTSGSTLGA